MNHLRTQRRSWIASLAMAWLLAVGPGLAGDPTTTDFPLGLDGSPSDGVLQLYRSANGGGDANPNVVCVGLINNVDGTAYQFEWPHAGPGGFQGQTGEGPSGAFWRWDTIGNVCGNPCIGVECLTVANAEDESEVGGLPPFPGLTTSVCNGGANLGKACITGTDCPGAACGPCGDVTNVSEASLVSSLHQFFGASSGFSKGTQLASVPVEVLQVDSTVRPVASGGFLYRTRIVNLSGHIVAFETSDSGAFADLACGSGQVNCGDVCCDGTSCNLDLCSGLQCLPPIPAECVLPGVICGGDCVNPAFDEQHCGGCDGAGGIACAAGDCCVDGLCLPCESGGAPIVLRPGEQLELCQTSPFPGKETLSKLAAFCDPSDGRTCDIYETGARGMINVLAPDPNANIPGDAPFLTVGEVQIADPAGNGNGLAQPGETVELTVTLNNAGGVGLPANAAAMLYSVDSICSGGTKHGQVCNPVAPDCPDGGTCPHPIAPAVSNWVGIGAGPGPGGAVGGDCDTPVGPPLPHGANNPVFTVAIPAGETPNTTRVFELSFDVCTGGTNSGEPCRDVNDCPDPGGSCQHICSDNGAPCMTPANCNLGAFCIEPSAAFPLGIRLNDPTKGARTKGVEAAEGCAQIFEPPLSLFVRPAVMVWTDVGNAYDVVGGTLAALRSNAGWTGLAVTCLADDNETPFSRLVKLCSEGANAGQTCDDSGDCAGSACEYSELDQAVPVLNPGDGYWFLVRDPSNNSYGTQNLAGSPTERPIVSCP